MHSLVTMTTTLSTASNLKGSQNTTLTISLISIIVQSPFVGDSCPIPMDGPSMEVSIPQIKGIETSMVHP